MLPSSQPLDHIVNVLQREAAEPIRHAIRVANDAYALDPDNNESGVFGYVLWKNLTTRLISESVAGPTADGSGKRSLVWGGDTLDRFFKIGLDIVRFHTVDPKTLVPFNGKTVKRLARTVDGSGTADLFFDEFGLPKVPMAVGRNLVVGLVASPRQGLVRVIVGELVQYVGSQRYGYDAPVAEVLGDFVPASAGSSVPVEAVPPVVVTLKTPQTEEAPDVDVHLRLPGEVAPNANSSGLDSNSSQTTGTDQ